MNNRDGVRLAASSITEITCDASGGRRSGWRRRRGPRWCDSAARAGRKDRPGRACGEAGRGPANDCPAPSAASARACWAVARTGRAPTGVPVFRPRLPACPPGRSDRGRRLAPGWRGRGRAGTAGLSRASSPASSAAGMATARSAVCIALHACAARARASNCRRPCPGRASEAPDCAIATSKVPTKTAALPTSLSACRSRSGWESTLGALDHDCAERSIGAA